MLNCKYLSVKATLCVLSVAILLNSEVSEMTLNFAWEYLPFYRFVLLLHGQAFMDVLLKFSSSACHFSLLHSSLFVGDTFVCYCCHIVADPFTSGHGKSCCDLLVINFLSVQRKENSIYPCLLSFICYSYDALHLHP